MGGWNRLGPVVDSLLDGIFAFIAAFVAHDYDADIITNSEALECREVVLVPVPVKVSE